MGKRSEFERKKKDLYQTPWDPMVPLAAHLNGGTFVEPCAGYGAMIRHLEKMGLTCVYACDIEPMADGIDKQDCLYFDGPVFPKADYIITNPPWEREVLHPLIEVFWKQAPTWLLFDADWMHTNQAKPYLKHCEKIVSVGRVSWEGNGVSGKDNCCWYLFGDRETTPLFYGRV